MGGGDRRGAAPLEVVICGRHAGRLSDPGGGGMAFRYSEGYAGPDLSVAAPAAAGAEFGPEIARPIFEGLLPDNMRARAAMARRAGTTRDDLFGLLEAYGRDCPGAVQVCGESSLGEVLAGTGAHVPVSEREIGRRLLEAASASQPSWHGPRESWSLGGNQGKIALARIGGVWHSCEGAAPSTHILKPGVFGMAQQAMVEFVTMKTAELVGIAVAKVEYAEFDGVPAVCIERYDRVRGAGGIARVHQEDLCQALGCLPKDKYNPTSRQVIDLLKRVSDGGSVMRFNDGLFYNYLVGGIDAHAKNYSLLHPAPGVSTLAPLYDIASVLPYEKAYTGSRWRKLAMSIGGYTNVGGLTGYDIRKHAEKHGLDAETLIDTMERLASTVPDAMAGAAALCAGTEMADVVGGEMLRTVEANCDAMLRNLRGSHRPGEYRAPALDLIYGGRLRWDDVPAAQRGPGGVPTPPRKPARPEDPIEGGARARGVASAWNAAPDAPARKPGKRP